MGCISPNCVFVFRFGIVWESFGPQQLNLPRRLWWSIHSSEDFEVDRYDLPRSKFGSAGGHFGVDMFGKKNHGRNQP